jgi:hypothetical protein
LRRLGTKTARPLTLLLLLLLLLMMMMVLVGGWPALRLPVAAACISRGAP